METKCYTVKVMSNREKSLSERIKLEMRRNQIEGEIFIPMERVYFAKNGKKAHREKIMYPGYLFIETANLATLQDILKSVPGATGVLKSKTGEPTILKANELEQIKRESNKVVETVDLLNYVVGETVEIIGGPFDKFRGTIDEINKEKNKVKLNVLIFGRPTPVDLSMEQIQKVLD
jgi:transcription termination/antitermination protein NusG